MDLVHGLPMDYPKWTTLKFVANKNLTMLKCEQKMQLINITCDVTDLIPNWTDLCHKTLEDKTIGSKGRILARYPFAVYVRVVGVQARDECDYICKAKG